MTDSTFVPYLATGMAGHEAYLGHLVVATIAISENAERALLDFSAKRKKSGRRLCSNLKDALLAIVPCEIISISPQKYNKMFAHLSNAELVAAWAYEKALANLLKAYPKYDKIAGGPEAPMEIVSEKMEQHGHRLQFGKEAPAPILAAATTMAILTRRERVEKLSEELGTTIPLEEEKAFSFAAGYLSRQGKAGLSRIAKLHFPLTEKLCQ